MPDNLLAKIYGDAVAEEVASYELADQIGGVDARAIEECYSRGLPSRELYPLDAPGMPSPGQDLIKLAKALGDGESCDTEILSMLYREMLYSAGSVHVPISVDAHRTRRLAVVTGHPWGSRRVTGPVHRNVMVIGKMLGQEEKHAGRNLVGATGELLQDCLESLGIDSYLNWYVTNLIKTEHPQADAGQTTLKSSWVNEFLPLLHQELRLVRPKYILCMGTDAVKALFGKRATGKGMKGRVIELTYSLGRSPDEEESHTALVMNCTHPAAVLRTPELEEDLKNDLARFGQLIRGSRPDQAETDLDHREIDSLDELIALHDEIQRTCEYNTIALDAEWHGEHPQNAGSYLRSIQLSWKFKGACYIHVRHPGGNWRFKGSQNDLIHWVTKIIEGRRLAGQFLTADLEWLQDFGFDLLPHYSVPDNWEEYMKVSLGDNPVGGFDVALALHAIEETADFSLTAQTLRFTTAPRYDVAMTEWRDKYCSENNLKKEELEGYGECPDDIISSYANYDADIVFRLLPTYLKLLSCDRFDNNCWEAFWLNMRTVPAVLEMNTAGMRVDRDRVDALSVAYLKARESLQDRVRTWARWPEMNLRSVYDVREFLFGEQLNGKNREDPNVPVRIRPPGAKSLYLKPIITTDKRPMIWDEVVKQGLEDQKKPSTNKTSLAIVAQESQDIRRRNPVTGEIHKFDFSEQVTWVRDFRFASQVLQSLLRSPETDEDDSFLIEDNNYVYSAGLPGAICDDGRVRTHFYPVKETGRWSSARPPLQNVAGKREADYKRILGDEYLYPLRTILRAEEGCVLVEADIAGAELLGMALLSGDEAMIAHALRAGLPESDPNYYDIHSNVTVLAFGLSCAPTKDGLSSIGKKHWRVAAKSVLFGLAYGRSAKAIALALKEEGVRISVDEAQKIIDAIFGMYPKLVPFFAECRRRAVDPRWLCGCFGRYRRAPVARDRMTVSELERQFMNFPIQNLVADAMDRGVDNLVSYRQERPDVEYKLVYQGHDAVILETPYAHAKSVMEEVLPECLSRRIPLYPTDLDGFPLGTGPYYFGLDVKPFIWWGQKISLDDCETFGFSPESVGLAS